VAERRLLQDAGGFELVWAFAAGAPLLGALIASRLPESEVSGNREERGSFISREALGPGGTFALSVVGFAAASAFLVLSLEEKGIGHGALAFSVLAGTVVATRLVAGGLPDRIGAARCALGAALVETAGLLLLGLAELGLVYALGPGGADRLASPAGAAAAGIALAALVAAAVGDPMPAPRYTDVGGVRFVRRASCCLLVRLPGEAMCTACPARPPAHRQVLLEDAAGLW
jgi:hypothetical protein